LIERAAMTRKVRAALENMMIGSVVRKRSDDNGTRPEIWRVREKNRRGCAVAEETREYT